MHEIHPTMALSFCFISEERSNSTCRLIILVDWRSLIFI